MISTVGTSYTSGWNGGYNQVTGQKQLTPKPITGSTNMATLIPHVGNFTWRILLSSQAETALNTITSTNGTSMEMLMSLLGTTLVSPPGTGAATNSTNASNANPGSNVSSSATTYQGSGSGTGVPAPHNLTFEDIVQGNQSSPIYQCLPFGSDPQYGINQTTSPNEKFSCMRLSTTTLGIR
jgi:hypothetical protein